MLYGNSSCSSASLMSFSLERLFPFLPLSDGRAQGCSENHGCVSRLTALISSSPTCWTSLSFLGLMQIAAQYHNLIESLSVRRCNEIFSLVHTQRGMLYIHLCPPFCPRFWKPHMLFLKKETSKFSTSICSSILISS